MYNRLFYLILLIISVACSSLIPSQSGIRYDNIAREIKTERKNILLVFPNNTNKYSIKLLNDKDIFLINGIEPCYNLEYKINKKTKTVSYVNFFTSRCDELHNANAVKNDNSLLSNTKCFKRFLKEQELFYIIFSQNDSVINFDELFTHLKAEEDIFVDRVGIDILSSNSLQQLNLYSIDQLNNLLKLKLNTCTIGDIFGNCLKDIRLEIWNKNIAKTNSIKRRRCCQ